TVTAKDKSGATATSTVTVTKVGVTLTKLLVTPAGQTVQVGATAQLTATGVFSDGTVADLTATATWSSSDDTLATVASGLVTGVAAGAPHITATHSTLSGQATVSVSAAALVSLVVQVPSASLAAGFSEQLGAVGLFSDQTSAYLASVTWATSDSS